MVEKIGSRRVVIIGAAFGSIGWIASFLAPSLDYLFLSLGLMNGINSLEDELLKAVEKAVILNPI